MGERFSFRAAPLDAHNINLIRDHFYQRNGVFIDLSTSIRYALQEVARQIKAGKTIGVEARGNP